MKLMAQLGAAQEGLGTRMAPPGGAAGDKKGFLEWAGARYLLLSFSGCAGPHTQRSNGIKFYKPSFLVHFQATAELG